MKFYSGVSQCTGDSRWMIMRLPLCRRAPNRLPVLVTLLSAALIVYRYVRPRDEAPESVPARLEDAVGRRNDEFIWSEKSQGWAIDNARQGKEANTRHEVPSCIWPEDCASDRIVDQLLMDAVSDKTFKIHIQKDYTLPEGPDVFASDKCLVNKCELTYDLDAADAIVFQNADVFREPPKERRSEQVWVAYLLESPVNTFDKRLERRWRGKYVFNWTASYRSDSDIVTPYSKFVPFSFAGFDLDKDRVDSLVRRKRSKVAWLVSNCRASNNRLEVARQLAQHIPVDIFGS